MMISFCLLCQSIVFESYICKACQPKLRRLCSPLRRQPHKLLSDKESPLVTSLFTYREPVRSLILRSKVFSDYRATSFLVEEFIRHFRSYEWAEECDVIVAAPSSAWGRLRGRFDIAGFMATELANKLGKPSLRLPHAYYWKLRKRALNKKSRELTRRKDSLQRYQQTNKKILVIDDVITTGQTVKNFIPFFAGNDLKILTFAEALSDLYLP